MPPPDPPTALDRLKAAEADLRRAAARALKWAKRAYPRGRRVQFSYLGRVATGVVDGYGVSDTGRLGLRLRVPASPAHRLGGWLEVGVDNILELLPEDPP